MSNKRKRSINKHKCVRKKMILLLLTAFSITLGSCIFGSSFSDAHGNKKETPVKYKYYKSIVIRSGDTLWDIATEYKTDDYESTQEYIEELKKVNDLKSDDIQESKHLLIAYYDKEFR